MALNVVVQQNKKAAIGWQFFLMTKFFVFIFSRNRNSIPLSKELLRYLDFQKFKSNAKR